MKSETRVGILGGGQLSRMLLLAAEKTGIRVLPLVETPTSPAVSAARHGAIVAGGQTPADLRMDAIQEFFARTDVVVFENEFVDCAELAKAAIDSDTRFFPKLSVIQALQDKLSQKRILAQCGIPSVRHDSYGGRPEDSRSIESWIDITAGRFPGGAILKWSKFGYDGYGNFNLSSGSDRQEAFKFIHAGLERGVKIFAEEKIEFQRELALCCVQSVSGELVYYPLVETKQEKGACKTVRGPVVKLGVDAEIELRAKEIVSQLANRLPILGAFSVEFFLTKYGELLVNEIAPRVHNSAHFSIDAAETSQFENHLRAAAGLALGSAASSPFFGMVNLLAPRDLTGEQMASIETIPRPGAADGVFTHWYEKDRLTPGRKMGHLNVAADTQEKLEEYMGNAHRLDESWLASIRKACKR